jgi:hypothetical protein
VKLLTYLYDLYADSMVHLARGLIRVSAWAHTYLARVGYHLLFKHATEAQLVTTVNEQLEKYGLEMRRTPVALPAPDPMDYEMQRAWWSTPPGERN